MIRKHKSEDNIDIEGAAVQQDESWRKSDADGNTVVVINDHVDPYISSALLR
jgi:hypothetical protein